MKTLDPRRGEDAGMPPPPCPLQRATNDVRLAASGMDTIIHCLNAAQTVLSKQPGGLVIYGRHLQVLVELEEQAIDLRAQLCALRDGMIHAAQQKRSA